MEDHRLQCSMVTVPGDDSRNEDKQDLNVILVPESVLLALSRSTNVGQDVQKRNLLSNDEQKTPSLLHGSNVGGIQTILENDEPLQQLRSNEFSSQGQSHTVLVLDGNSEWLVDTNLSDGLPKNADAYFLANNEHDSSPLRVDQSGSSLERTASTLMLAEQIEDEHGSDNYKKAEEKTKLHKCSVFNCYKKFSSEEELKSHIEEHDKGTKVHQCQFPGCPWSFSTPYKLRRHASSHQQTKLFKCSHPGCDVSCSTKYNLKAHEQVHKSEEKSFCSLCNISFSSKLKMLKHQRLKHEREAMFSCSHEGCNKKFHTIAARTTHLKTHQRTEITCSVEGCGKKFKQPAVYREHFMYKHTQIRPYKCKHPKCNWEFTTNSKLKRHMLTHTDLKCWPCPIENCSARFFRKEHVKSHLKTHTSESEGRRKGSNDPDAPIVLTVEGMPCYFCPYEDCRSLFTTMGGAKIHIQKMHSTAAKKQNKSEVAVSESNDTMTERQHAVCMQGKALSDNSCESTNCASSPEECDAPTSQVQPTQSILRTLMQAESSADIIAANETLNADTPVNVPLTLSQAHVSSANFIATCTSQQLNVSSTSIPQSSSSSSLDSRFVLIGTNAIEFPISNSVQSLQDGLSFTNVSNSMFTSTSSSVAVDQFLTFNECVHAVDPNVVMAIKTPIQNMELLETNNESESSGDEIEIPAMNSNKADLFEQTGGSARTDGDAYRKIKIRKQWNPITIEERKPESLSENKSNSYDTTIDSFILHDSEVLSHSQLDPKMSVNQHFEGSTINLSDLA